MLRRRALVFLSLAVEYIRRLLITVIALTLSKYTFNNYYYYYSHIFPDFRAQHCNYATLLAGRCGNKLWYSVIFPMGPSFLSMLVFVVRVIGFLCKPCVHFSGLYFATISGLYLSFPLPRCGCLYWVEIFRNGVNLCPLLRSSCFTSIGLWGVYCVKESSSAPYVHSTACPSYADALSSKRRLDRRWISSVYYPYGMFLYLFNNCNSAHFALLYTQQYDNNYFYEVYC